MILERLIGLEDNRYMCPLLKKEISEGYCYDVNMVAYGFIKTTAIDDELPIGASEVCMECQYTQLTE